MSISNEAAPQLLRSFRILVVLFLGILIVGFTAAYIHCSKGLLPAKPPLGSTSHSFIEIPQVFTDTDYVHQYSVGHFGPWMIETWTDGTHFKPTSVLSLTYRITSLEVDVQEKKRQALVSAVNVILYSRVFQNNVTQLEFDHPEVVIKSRKALFVKPSLTELFRLINLPSRGHAFEVTTSINLAELPTVNLPNTKSVNCLVLSTLAIEDLTTQHEAVVVLESLGSDEKRR